MFSPGFGRVPPSLGWDCTGLVAWLLLAPRGWRPPCQSTLVARSVVLWRWCVRTSVFTLFPHVVRGTLVMTGRSRHCRITAGLASMDIPLLVSSVESRLWGSCLWLYCTSWLAQGVFPCFAYCPTSSVLKRSSFGFSASCFALSLRDGVTLSGRVCLSPRSERRLFLHLPGVWFESS